MILNRLPITIDGSTGHYFFVFDKDGELLLLSAFVHHF
jgi:hypothetical protein